MMRSMVYEVAENGSNLDKFILLNFLVFNLYRAKKL